MLTHCGYFDFVLLHQTEMWNFALNNLNLGFICIFTTECALKIFALRQHYFKAGRF